MRSRRRALELTEGSTWVSRRLAGRGFRAGPEARPLRIVHRNGAGSMAANCELTPVVCGACDARSRVPRRPSYRPRRRERMQASRSSRLSRFSATTHLARRGLRRHGSARRDGMPCPSRGDTRRSGRFRHSRVAALDSPPSVPSCVKGTVPSRCLAHSSFQRRPASQRQLERARFRLRLLGHDQVVRCAWASVEVERDVPSIICAVRSDVSQLGAPLGPRKPLSRLLAWNRTRSASSWSSGDSTRRSPSQGAEARTDLAPPRRRLLLTRHSRSRSRSSSARCRSSC